MKLPGPAFTVLLTTACQLAGLLASAWPALLSQQPGRENLPTGECACTHITLLIPGSRTQK